MSGEGKLPALNETLKGETLFQVGRLHGLTRRRLEELVRARGGKVAAKPTPRVSVISFGHSADSSVLPDGQLRLPTGLPATAAMISENELRRRLGLLGAPPQIERTLGVSDLQRLTGL